jgi:molybdopterin converting factor small subunit
MKYFGKIREILGTKTEEYTVNEKVKLMDLLLNHIPRRHHKMSNAWIDAVFRKIKGELVVNKDGTPEIRNYLILINAKTQKLSYSLRDGDEIAILPPFGGGTLNH